MMNMEQVIVKSQGETSGELMVFYVDENGSHEEGVITAIQNIDQSDLEQLQQENYIIEAVDETSTEVEVPAADQQTTNRDRWLDEETKRLLIFYIDNKETFLNGITKKKHLWTVACKTMLTSKNATSCEMKLRNLKRSYSVIRVDQAKGKGSCIWPYYDLCHHAFHDDSYVNMLISEAMECEGISTTVPAGKHQDNGILVVKKVNATRSADEKVEQMLNLYNAHKKSNIDNWQKHLWETISIELGEDGEYWHKRFLNFKQHYIRMLDKRRESGSESIIWPYMKIFDQIYENDKDFLRKYGTPLPKQPANISHSVIMQSLKSDWDETEKTVLVKYCFDSFDEFQDPKIPNGFLWNEVGRLLDKPPDMCKRKFEVLKIYHLNQYIDGKYEMRNRKPISILFDNIISKETEMLLSKPLKKPTKVKIWDTDETDMLIQLLYANLEMFKDPICHFVCFAAVSKQLNQSIHNCYSQWRELTALYKSVLDEKKEDPELEIDWRYTEMFDRIFDYGMDTKLMEGYEKPVELPVKSDTVKVGVKKLKIKLEDELSENEDFEEYDERGFVKRTRGTGDSKQFKILEYYQKNKDRFSTTQRKKQALWEVLAKQIGISAEQCAHRFRNLKQVYQAYIQREINKPEMPILWPYYNLCKKVFGYRAIKNKLRNGKIESDDSEDWTPKQIKQVINYFAKNFSEIDRNSDDKDQWVSLAREIGRSEMACRDKFLELRKAYRKIKTMMNRNPNCKVNWKYFKMFDQIYTGASVEDMDVDSSDEKYGLKANAVKTEVDDDDDYQCIIVVPEGEELTDISNAQIIIKGTAEPPAPVPPVINRYSWGLRSKKLLLKTYLEYIQSQKGKIINTKDMWVDISKIITAKPFSCKKMYIRLKTEYKQKLNDEQYINTSPYYKLFTKIMACKPKFFQPKLTIHDINLSDRTTYKDIILPLWKVEQALQYYLDHMDQFICPSYEAKYAWEALSKHVSLPVFKIFNKVNFLKHNYNIETGEVAGKKVDFHELLNRIFEKEFALRINMATAEIEPMAEEDVEDSWEDDDTEKLLNWYLDNLDKFKNPQNVPSSLWMEASNVLKKTPLACSKKMSEIRTQYSSMVKETPEALVDWRFHELCQKIYGTGKKSTPVNSD